jgi:hypothetical protein
MKTLIEILSRPGFWIMPVGAVIFAAFCLVLLAQKVRTRTEGPRLLVCIIEMCVFSLLALVVWLQCWCYSLRVTRGGQTPIWYEHPIFGVGAFCFFGIASCCAYLVIHRVTSLPDANETNSLFLAPNDMKTNILLLLLIVILSSVLSLASICGGIYAIYSKALADTSFDALGFHLKSGHVGVAFVGIGLATAFLTAKAVLSRIKLK